MWLSPTPDRCKPVSAEFLRCCLCYSKLGSLAGIPVPLWGLRNGLVFVRWHIPCWYKAKESTAVTHYLVRSLRLSQKLRWEEVFILKIWVIITCFSVSSGWRYQGKVRKYMISFFTGSTILSLERGADFCLFLGFRKVLFVRFPYSVVVSNSCF